MQWILELLGFDFHLLVLSRLQTEKKKRKILMLSLEIFEVKITQGNGWGKKKKKADLVVTFNSVLSQI